VKPAQESERGETLLLVMPGREKGRRRDSWPRYPGKEEREEGRPRYAGTEEEKRRRLSWPRYDIKKRRD